MDNISGCQVHVDVENTSGLTESRFVAETGKLSMVKFSLALKGA